MNCAKYGRLYKLGKPWRRNPRRAFSLLLLPLVVLLLLFDCDDAGNRACCKAVRQRFSVDSTSADVHRCCKMAMTDKPARFRTLTRSFKEIFFSRQCAMIDSNAERLFDVAATCKQVFLPAASTAVMSISARLSNTSVAA